MSLGFLECKDPRGRMDLQDKRVMLENLDFRALKGQEDPLEYPVTQETQDFLAFLVKMVLQVPQVSQDATVQREKEGRSGPPACLDSVEILAHRGYQE